MIRFLLLIFSILLIGCQPAEVVVVKHPKKIIKAKYSDLKSFYFKDFSTLIVGNNTSVKLMHGGYNKVTSKTLKVVKVGSHASLLIDNKDKTRKIVYLTVKQLPKKIILNGNSNILVKAKSQQSIKIITKAKGQIRLVGWFNLVEIDNRGGADIYAHWLTGRQVRIFSNGGNIQLAGKCNHLLLQLADKACFDGTGLNANHIWVNSSGDTAASLLPLNSLHALASANSQVAYLHQLPLNQVVRSVYDSANVVFVNKYHPNVRYFQAPDITSPFVLQ